MKKHYSLIALLAPLITSNASAVELSKHLSTITDPVPISRIEPKYPINAAKERREGWARFSFIIEKDGSVSNVISTENSGSKDITLAAKKALMKWQYEPAMENGEPIQQCVNSVQMDFRMNKNGTTGATKRFKSLFSKAQNALTEKDFAQVDKYLASLKKIKYMHKSENNYLQLLLAEYARVLGDDSKQLSHLYKVSLAFENGNSEQELSVLQQRFALEVKLNRFKSAFRTFKRIEKSKLAEPYLEQYQALIKQIDDFIGSNENIVVDANMRNNDYWQYSLVRNEFSLTNIEGSLSKMDIRCANKRHVYTIEENNTWKIPESWQHCNLFIYGENNASFNVVEHPFKA